MRLAPWGPCLFACLSAAAAEPLTRSEQAVVNFGFATQLGSGVYSLSGRTLQVYRLPFEWTLPFEGTEQVRYRLTLPVTVGFLDFRPGDVLQTGLPQHLDSYGVVPGVEVDLRVRERWLLQPYAQAGIARDASLDVDQRVYAFGLRSYYDFGRGATQWQQYDELARVVVEQRPDGPRDDLTRLRVGLTARRPLRPAEATNQADVLGYAFVEAYTDAPGGPAGAAGDRSAPPQYEVGFTLGATQGLRIWKLPVPRLGFGYRFGDGLEVYRLVIGSPY